MQTKRHDVEMSVRGLLRGFGLKVGPTTPRTFEARVCELVDGHPTLVMVADALLAARAELQRRLKDLEKQILAVGRADQRVRRLMTVPGVGNLVALTFTTAIDDPARFRSSRQVGAYFGLTPSRYQSGETDVAGRISKIGDHGVRTGRAGAPARRPRGRQARPARSAARPGCWTRSRAAGLRFGAPSAGRHRRSRSRAGSC